MLKPGKLQTSGHPRHYSHSNASHPTCGLLGALGTAPEFSEPTVGLPGLRHDLEGGGPTWVAQAQATCLTFANRDAGNHQL